MISAALQVKSRSRCAGLIILERAMANVNRGQGVGFAVPLSLTPTAVGGLVVDKKMLKLVGMKVGAGAWA